MGQRAEGSRDADILPLKPVYSNVPKCKKICSTAKIHYNVRTLVLLFL